MNFIGTGRRLTAKDVQLIAGYLGCHIAAVRAVLIVESAGNGFAADKRPIILNEPHVFYRELSGSQRTTAVNQGLAYQKWGAKPYLRTQNERYNWLANAMKINPTVALRSCSWGLGQVMGFNHAVCGFNTVQDFVTAQLVSEGAHLYTMARFIVGNRLQRHLRNHDWRAFARGYNGPGYEANDYHTKLANAYNARPQGERVTPPPTSEADLMAMIAQAIVAPPEPELEVIPEPLPEEIREKQPYQPPPDEIDDELPDLPTPIPEKTATEQSQLANKIVAGVMVVFFVGVILTILIGA